MSEHNLKFYCSECDEQDVPVKVDVYVATNTIYRECKICGTIDKEEA